MPAPKLSRSGAIAAAGGGGRRSAATSASTDETTLDAGSAKSRPRAQLVPGTGAASALAVSSVAPQSTASIGIRSEPTSDLC